jgi:hypothetical protein
MWSVEALAGTAEPPGHVSRRHLWTVTGIVPLLVTFGASAASLSRYVAALEREASARAHPEPIAIGHEDSQLRHGTLLGIWLQARDIRRSDRPEPVASGVLRGRSGDPSLPPANTQAQDAMSIEGPAPARPL